MTPGLNSRLPEIIIKGLYLCNKIVVRSARRHNEMSLLHTNINAM